MFSFQEIMDEEDEHHSLYPGKDSRVFKFVATAVSENVLRCTLNGLIHVISAMEVYKHKSLEELRHEYYQFMSNYKKAEEHVSELEKSLEEFRHEFYQATLSGKKKETDNGPTKFLEELHCECCSKHPVSDMSVKVSQTDNAGSLPSSHTTSGTCSSTGKNESSLSASPAGDFTSIFKFPTNGISEVPGSTPSISSSHAPPVVSTVTSENTFTTISSSFSPDISGIFNNFFSSKCTLKDSGTSTTSSTFPASVVASATTGGDILPVSSVTSTTCASLDFSSAAANDKQKAFSFTGIKNGPRLTLSTKKKISQGITPTSRSCSLSGKEITHSKVESDLELPTAFGRTVKATQTWFEEPAIETQISCPICSEIYIATSRSPVALPQCGHAFCRSCLQGLEETGSVVCPTCEKTHLGASVSDLPVLHPILSLSEAYRKAKDAGCVLERCETHGDQLCIWCRECSKALCGLCLIETNYHKDHNLERIIDPGDIEKKIQKHARIVVEFSKEQQNKVLTELQVSIRRVVELCSLSSAIEDQVTTVSEVLENRGKKLGIKPSMEALIKLDDILQSLHQATESLNQESDPGSQADQSDSLKEGNTSCNDLSRTPKISANDSGESDSGVSSRVLVPRCCGKTDDGRQMDLQIKDNQLHLCALSNATQDAPITVQVPFLELFISQDKPEVFFELSVNGHFLGRVYIQLWGHLRRARHFLSLCLGTLGPSYKGSKFDDVLNKDQSGEVLVCTNYIDENGSCSKGLMDNLEWDGEYRQLQKSGQLIATGGGKDKKNGSFGICTKSNFFKTFSCPFGTVVSGMDIIQEVVHNYLANDIIISEVGAVALDKFD